MSAHKIESGRDRASGKGGLMPVAATTAGCPARARLSFARRNERRYGWGDDPRTLWHRIDWGFVLFAAGYSLATGTVLYVALVRAG